MTTQRLWDAQNEFFIGCNYWASHAGTAMWSDWRPDIVERDLKKLADEELEVLRVFPLWPEFQPIRAMYGGGGSDKGVRFGEHPLPDDAMGRAGVSREAMDKFRQFAEMAQRHGLKLIVGLVTGWMSGRLFVPQALEGRNILTDPVAIQWQVRFVKCFVRTFKTKPAIVAWDLGNECNVMGSVSSSEEAWLWTSAISGAVKSEDADRPLISGMHGLSPSGIWRMQDQGELTDVLTTHPYPFWTKYADYDPVTTMRPLLHATAESLFYAHLGGKPCFAEEMGTMGPMVANQEAAAAFLRASMLSLWAHGCHGLLWWCAFDQTHHMHAPYDWCACEGELGLVTEDGRAKPVISEMGRLKRVIAQLPFAELPPRKTEAVCILNTAQEHWAVAFGSFLLAKQAGFDLDFQYENQPLRDAALYMLPCMTGVNGFPKDRWLALLAKVREGADLYISIDDGYLLEFEKVTGLMVKGRGKRRTPATVNWADRSRSSMIIDSSLKLSMEAVQAEVLATESGGNPVFTVNPYGKGRIYFFSLPLELNFIRQPEACYQTEEYPYRHVYEEFSQAHLQHRVIRSPHPLVGVTEHDADPQTRIAVLINYSPEPLELALGLAAGWEVADCHYGQVSQEGAAAICSFKPNDAIILTVSKAG